MDHYHDRSQQYERSLATHVSNILSRPSATSEEYAYYNDDNNINSNPSVSIHNTLDLQSWEQRRGIINRFAPQRWSNTFTREPAPAQQQQPSRDRQRSRSPRNDSNHYNDSHTESSSRHDINHRKKQYDNRTGYSYEPRWNEGHRHQSTRSERVPLPPRFEVDDTLREVSIAKSRSGGYAALSNDGQWNTVPAINRRDRRRLDRERGINNTNNINDNDNDYNRTTNEHAPPQISYIAPTSSNNNPTFKPFMLLLVGIPGSGKSTFATCLVDGKPWMYVRVNQDSLGNRSACEELAKKAIADGKCPIIDRCNFNKQQRKNFLDIAAKAGVPVDGVVFRYPMALCVRRCQTRHDHETIDPRDAQGIVQRMSEQFTPPLMSSVQEESFRSLKTVANVSTFHNVLMEFLNAPCVS